MSSAFVFLTVPSTLYFKDISYQFLMNGCVISNAGEVIKSKNPVTYFDNNIDSVGKLIKFKFEHNLKQDEIYLKVKKCLEDSKVKYFSLIIMESIGPYWVEDGNIKYPEER